MKGFNFKSYLESKVNYGERQAGLNQDYDKLKLFFESITTVLLERDLLIILLSDLWDIISIYSTDNEDYNYLHNGKFRPDGSSAKGRILGEEFDESQVNIFLSPLFENGYEDVKYKFVLLSTSENSEILNNLSYRLKSSLDSLFKYDQKQHRDYHDLQDLLDSVDEGISACDNKGRVTYINKAGLSIFKSPREDIVNKSLDSLVTNSILVKVVKTKEAYLDIEYFIDYKGKNIHLLSSAYPVFDKNKNIIGAVDVYRRIKRSFKAATDLVGYKATYSFDNFIWESQVMGEAINISKQFANSIKNVLIIGESGTGKELFAQALHNYSIRRNGPFVAINCASYPKDLFESELFGYEEGAFTGAKKGGKAGKFELADGGTLFLDEIGEMPLHLQAKLLRIIETKSISRIGSNKNTTINVRIIAATNRNLEDMVKNNSFREDLYYRLKVLYLKLPPLREREDDSILLANYFIKKFTQDSIKNILGLDKEAEEYFKSYGWPGNIRELENIISLSLFYCEGDHVTKEDLIKAGLRLDGGSPVDNFQEKQDLSTITSEIILKTLEKNKGNKKKTAEELGISRNTIYRLLK